MRIMRKIKLPVSMLLVLCLLFSSFTIAFAAPPNTINNEPQYIIEPGDDGGGHLCAYEFYSHIVTQSEAIGYQTTSATLIGALMLFIPTATTVQQIVNVLIGAGASVYTNTAPIAGDRIDTSYSVSYNFVEDEYQIVIRTYTYRPTWDGGQTLVDQTYFTDTYSQYSYYSTYLLWQERCPHVPY